MFPIASITVGAGGASGGVFFNNIPQTFTHLQFRIFGRTQNAGVTSIYVPATASTPSHYLQGDGASVTSTAQSGLPYGFYGTTVPSATSTFGSYILDILDYANTNKYKTYRIVGGWDANGSGRVTLGSTLQQSTSAMTSFYFDTENGFAQYSRIDLYGISTSNATGA